MFFTETNKIGKKISFHVLTGKWINADRKGVSYEYLSTEIPCNSKFITNNAFQHLTLTIQMYQIRGTIDNLLAFF
jgi:hypothetical protein